MYNTNYIQKESQLAATGKTKQDLKKINWIHIMIDGQSVVQVLQNAIC